MLLIRVLVTAAWFVLAAPEAARADFITAAIVGFLGITSSFGSAVVSVLVGVALNFGMSLLQKALTPKQKEQPEPGVRLDVKMSDDDPIAFVMGNYATAGTRKYIATWGKNGKTPNAYLTDVIQIGDMPSDELVALWVNGERVDILWDEYDEDRGGYPVEQFRDDEGFDHIWVRFRDGRETTADAFLRDKFGDDDERPWTAEMIGRGCAAAIITTRVNREMFQGIPTFLFRPRGIPLYDVRKDSTAGGSGSHRWSDDSTWEYSDNPAVMIYNIIRGIYYGDEWVYGGQNIAAFRLPAASWMAAANECDRQIALKAGGTEKQFRAGIEITGDLEPLEAVEEIAKACNGRVAEVGGIFKLLVGSPGAAVMSLSDDDIVVTKSQQFRPFPRLGETHNGMTASYPEPREAWAMKDAPPRYSASLEALDGNRRLVTGVTFRAVPYAAQVQRLMKAMIEEDRRFRQHAFFLGPEAWVLEPNDVVSWTSARNGYVNKKFVIVQIEGERSFNQFVALKEIDPKDYDWSSDEEIDSPVGPLVTVRPPAQAVIDWAAEPYTLVGADGSGRPAIRLFWDGEDQPDIVAVRWRVRLADTEEVVHEGRTESVEAGVAIITQSLLRNTDYQAQGRYVPGSGRRTLWSDWLDVTTPDVKAGASDIEQAAIQHQHLTEQLRAEVDLMTSSAMGSFAALRTRMEDALQRLAVAGAGATTGGYSQRQAIRRELVVRSETAMAAVVEEQTVRIEQDEALATSIDLVVAQVGTVASAVTTESAARVAGDSANASSITALTTRTDQISAGGYIKLEAIAAGPEGSARFEAFVNAGTVGTPNWKQAGFVLEVSTAGVARALIIADQFAVAPSLTGAATLPLLVSGGVVYINEGFIRNLTGVNISVNSISTVHLQVDSVTFEKIIENAVTQSVAVSSTTPQDLNENTTETILTATIDTINRPVLIVTNALYEITSDQYLELFLRVKRNGTLLQEWRMLSMENNLDMTMQGIWVDKTPGTGSRTYTLEAEFEWNFGANTGSFDDVDITDRVMALIQMKNG